jgi:cytochrome c-type biogenesis protein CcmH/NrfG
MSLQSNCLDVYDVPFVRYPQSASVNTGALAAYAEAIQSNPANAEAHVELAWLLATHPDDRLRDGRRAISLARRAITLGSAHPALYETLAAAYAEAGDFDEAVLWRAESLDAAIHALAST